MLRTDMQPEPGVVLSGSIVGYGAEVEDAFDLIVFLYLPADIRVERLRAVTSSGMATWILPFSCGRRSTTPLRRGSRMCGKRCLKNIQSGSSTDEE